MYPTITNITSQIKKKFYTINAEWFLEEIIAKSAFI